MIKKTAIFSAHTIHIIHLFVRDLLIASMILFVVAVGWLVHGISVERLSFGGYTVEGLYLKLDKKLTLEAKRVTIPKKKADPSFGSIDETFSNVNRLLHYFEHILLKEVVFENNRFFIEYTRNVIRMRSAQYEIEGKVSKRRHTISVNVDRLGIPRLALEVSGKFLFDTETQQLESEGNFTWFDAKGRFSARKNGDKIVYALKSAPFEKIEPIVERFGLPRAVSEWIGDRVAGQRYRLDFLKGEYMTDDTDPTLNLMRMEASVHVENARVRFHDSLPAATAKDIVVHYRNGALYFTLDAPRYEGRSLDGSSVSIRHLVSGKAVLKLDLKARTPVDKRLLEIPETYGIKLPLLHNNPEDEVRVVLKIPLYKHPKQKLRAKADVVLKKGMLHIVDVVLPIFGAKAHYEDTKVYVHDVSVVDSWYEIDVKRGEVDLSKKGARLEALLKRVAFGDKKHPLLVIKNRPATIRLSYEEPFTLVSDSLGMRLQNEENGTIAVTLTDLSKWIPYARIDTLGISGGTLDLKIDDKKIGFRGKLVVTEGCLFVAEKGSCVGRIDIAGTYDKTNDRLILSALGGKVRYDSKTERITLDKVGIDLKRFLALQKRTNASKQTFAQKKALVIIGKKSPIRYDNYRLVTDSYDIEIKPNGDIVAYGSLDGDVVKLTKKGKIFHLQALRIKDSMLHPLINFKGLKGGRYSIEKKGDPDKTMHGRIIIEGGTLSDFAAYNNTVAFINTLPALATLNNPGFSAKGFKIEEGIVYYRMTPKRLFLDKVYLKGKSATIVGKGTITIPDGKLDIGLAVRTAREFGKVVGKIPVLGYILLGEDKSITLGLSVKGTLKKPRVRTSVAKDILTLPLEFIRRTLTLPAKASAPTLPDIPDYVVEENNVTAPSTHHSPASKTEPASPEKKKTPIRSEAPSKDRSPQLF